MTNEADIKEAVAFLSDSLEICLDIMSEHLNEGEIVADVKGALQAHREVLINAGLLNTPEPVAEASAPSDAPAPSLSVADAVAKLSSTSSAELQG